MVPFRVLKALSKERRTPNNDDVDVRSSDERERVHESFVHVWKWERDVCRDEHENENESERAENVSEREKGIGIF